MKKRFFHYLLILAFLAGCATEMKVVDNTFFCSYPKLELTVSPEFQYMGQQGIKTDSEAHGGGYYLTIFSRAFMFIDPVSERLIAISVTKAPRDSYWLAPSMAFETIKRKLDYGKCRLGNYTYDYCIFSVNGNIAKIHLRNASGDTYRAMIYYQESKANYENITSDQEILEAFNKKCQAALTIEAEKIASLSKPDSSISADYQKIIGHWWMEGEAMVIEEIDHRLSIRMDRLRGYHRGSSGQAKYREITHSHNISWDGKHLEFEIWMPSGAGTYEVYYSLTLSDPNALFGTKQAGGSPTKIEVEFKRR